MYDAGSLSLFWPCLLAWPSSATPSPDPTCPEHVLHDAGSPLLGRLGSSSYSLPAKLGMLSSSVSPLRDDHVAGSSHRSRHGLYSDLLPAKLGLKSLHPSCGFLMLALTMSRLARSARTESHPATETLQAGTFKSSLESFRGCRIIHPSAWSAPAASIPAK